MLLAGGALIKKSFNDAYSLIEDMTQNQNQWGSERTPIWKTQPKAGMYEVNDFDHMNARVYALYHKLDNLSIAQHMVGQFKHRSTTCRDGSTLEQCGAKAPHAFSFFFSIDKTCTIRTTLYTQSHLQLLMLTNY